MFCHLGCEIGHEVLLPQLYFTPTTATWGPCIKYVCKNSPPFNTTPVRVNLKCVFIYFLSKNSLENGKF